MGAKRKDAAKKQDKDEALTNGEVAREADAGQPVMKESSRKEVAAKAAAEAPSSKGNGSVEQAAPALEAAKEAATKVAGTAKAAATKTAAQAKAAAAFVKKRPTDVALVLSLINSAVLLALLGGLGGAGYLARTGRLEGMLHSVGGPVAGSSSAQGFFALSATDIDGAHVPMSRYAGRLVVVANVASEDHVRGYTLQNYQRLNYLYDKYRSRGLEILAFPCNQFGGLEPGSNADVKATVRTTYNATFPLFSKVDVNGPGAHPVWRFLLAHQPPNHGYPPTVDWNFNKFVVSKLGFPLVRYPLTFDDEDLEGIEGWIQANL